MEPANGLAGLPEKAAGREALSPFFVASISAAVTEIETQREMRVL
jgi:hypothetical protein